VLGCASPFTTETLADGPHTFTVRATDLAGNVDQVGDTRHFTVDTSVLPPPPPPPDTPPPASQPPVTTSNTVIFGSLVLISGRSVRLVGGKVIPVSLTCSGQRKCEGQLTVTRDKPLKKATKGKRKAKKKRKRATRLERLGSQRFAIEGNRSARVMVTLSRSKVRLVKRLKRLTARATIREIDVHGHPRISTRTFLLRAR